MIVRTIATLAAALLASAWGTASPAAAHSMGASKDKDLTPPVQRYLKEVEDLKNGMGEAADAVRSVFDRFDLWDPAIPVTACFLDGGNDLRRFLVDASQDWTKGTGLRIEFGAPPAYAACDAANPADVRISFKGKGNWSYVGTVSLAPDLVAAPSLNVEVGDAPFGDLDKVVLKGTILHELGHALGLEHEHQSPTSHCDDEFDWDKVYAYAKDNWGWEKDQVDTNMRSLVNQDRLLMSPYDPHSIMHYYFDAWMFKKGQQSRCYVGHNETLSDVDRTAVREVYPPDVASLSGVLQNQADQAGPVLSTLALTRDQLSLFGRKLVERLNVPGRKPLKLQFDVSNTRSAGSGARSLDQVPMVSCGTVADKSACHVAEDASALSISIGE